MKLLKTLYLICLLLSIIFMVIGFMGYIDVPWFVYIAPYVLLVSIPFGALIAMFFVVFLVGISEILGDEFGNKQKGE